MATDGQSLPEDSSANYQIPSKALPVHMLAWDNLTDHRKKALTTVSSPVAAAAAEATAAATSAAKANDTFLAEQVEDMNEAAVLANPPSLKPFRGPDGRLPPVLTLPGDTLETTPLMIALTAVSTIEAVGVVGRAFWCSSNPLWPLFSVGSGILAGELFTGVFHWATDNYGSLKTPVVGFACAAFQGHHLSPWTISHRSFVNNVYKIAGASIPLMSAGVLLLSPSAAAFLAVMLYCQLLAQDFHRWTHTPPRQLPAWKRRLQAAGIALPFAEHLAHHKPPFDKHYCILTGKLNTVLDTEPVLLWRRLEALVYHLNGQEPNSWKDPKVKDLALSTWPYAERALQPLQDAFSKALKRADDDHSTVDCVDPKPLGGDEA